MPVPNQNFVPRLATPVVNRYEESFSVTLEQDTFTRNAIPTPINVTPEITALTIEWGSRGKDYGFLPSSCRFTYFDHSLQLGNRITEALPREYKVIVRREGVVIWWGYLLPENIEQRIDERGRFLNLEATDGIPFLFNMPYAERLTERKTYAWLLAQGFQQIRRDEKVLLNNLITPFRSSGNELRGFETLTSMYIDREALAGETWGDIIEREILERFGLIGCISHSPRLGPAIFDKNELETDTITLVSLDTEGVREAPEVTMDLEPILPSRYALLFDTVIEAQPPTAVVETVWARGYDERGFVLGDNMVDNGDFQADPLPDEGWTFNNRPLRHGGNLRAVKTIIKYGGEGLLEMPVGLTGSATPERYAESDLFRVSASSPSVFGLRLTFRSRWWIDGTQDAGDVTNTLIQYALIFEGEDAMWCWSAAQNKWEALPDDRVQLDARIVRNDIRPGGDWTDYVIDTRRPPERGQMKVRIYEGVDARIMSQPHLVAYLVDDVAVQTRTAAEGQETVATRQTTNHKQIAAENLILPHNGAFIFGSQPEADVEYRRRITNDADALSNSFGFKIGRYRAANEDPLIPSVEQSTGMSLDEATARKELAWRDRIGQELRGRMKVGNAELFTPSQPFVYSGINPGDRYQLNYIRNDILNQYVDVIGIRIRPDTDFYLPETSDDDPATRPAGLPLRDGQTDEPHVSSELVVVVEDGPAGASYSPTAAAADGQDAVGYEELFAVHSEGMLPADLYPSNDWGYNEPGTFVEENILWFDNPPDDYGPSKPYLWRSQNIGNGWGEFVELVRTDGSRYPAADDIPTSPVREIFCAFAEARDTPPRVPADSWDGEGGGFTVFGLPLAFQWHTGLQGVTAAKPYLYMTRRRVIGQPDDGAAVAAEWDAPVVVGYRGQDMLPPRRIARYLNNEYRRNDSEIYLRWTLPHSGGPVDHYRIQYRLLTSGVWGQWNDVGTTEEGDYLISGVPSGFTQWETRIRTENAAGESAWKEARGTVP